MSRTTQGGTMAPLKNGRGDAIVDFDLWRVACTSILRWARH